MVLFMVVILIASTEAIVQNFVIAGRRQREEETIWRGQQYVRAIRLYYHKTGHYPQTIDDLKKGMPELHFLRYAAYKDRPIPLAVPTALGVSSTSMPAGKSLAAYAMPRCSKWRCLR